MQTVKFENINYAVATIDDSYFPDGYIIANYCMAIGMINSDCGVTAITRVSRYSGRQLLVVLNSDVSGPVEITLQFTIVPK